MGAVLGVSSRRIHQLVKEGMPKTARGKYYIPAAVQWYITHKLMKAGADKTLDEQRKELIFEQTVKTRIDNEVSRRDLVPMSEVQTVFGTAQVTLASQLDAFPRRMAIVLAGTHDENEIENLLFTECREIRRSYADVLDQMGPAAQGDGSDAKAPAPKKRQRVGRPRKDTATG